MAFSGDGRRLLVASGKKDHATVHVFALSDDDVFQHPHKCVVSHACTALLSMLQYGS